MWQAGLVLVAPSHVFLRIGAVAHVRHHHKRQADRQTDTNKQRDTHHARSSSRERGEREVRVGVCKAAAAAEEEDAMRAFAAGFLEVLGRDDEGVEGQEEGEDAEEEEEAWNSEGEDEWEQVERHTLQLDDSDEEDGEEEDALLPTTRNGLKQQMRRMTAYTEAARRLADALAVARTCTDLETMASERKARLEGRASEAAKLARSSKRPGRAATAFLDAMHRLSDVVVPPPEVDASPTLRLLFDDQAERPEGLVVEVDEQVRWPTMLRIGGAPMRGFVVQAALHVGARPRASDMARYWLDLAQAVQRRWETRSYIPRMRRHVEVVDLCACTLHQHLEMINGCVWRVKLYQPVDPVVRAMQEEGDDDGMEEMSMAKDTGLKLLNTGQPMHAPVTQPPPLLSSEEMQEAQQMQQQGSIGLGCAQLRADMQGFKACNEGATLADFVRWYSPSDWEETATTAGNHPKRTNPGEEQDGSEPTRAVGRLSARMSAKDSLWAQLFDSAQPLPVQKQTPLMDAPRAGDAAVRHLLEVAPSDLFEQLLVVAVGSAQLEGAILAHAMASLGAGNEALDLAESFGNFLATTCGRGMGPAKVDHICNEAERVAQGIVEELSHALRPD